MKTPNEYAKDLERCQSVKQIESVWRTVYNDNTLAESTKNDLWAIYQTHKEMLQNNPPKTRLKSEGKGEGPVPPSPEKEEREPDSRSSGSGGYGPENPVLEPNAKASHPAPPQTSLAVPMELRRFSIEAVEVAVNNANDIGQMMQKKMKRDHHYGLIPGAKKDSLWQPGADLILSGFRYYDEPFHTERTEDEDGHIRITIYSRIHPLGHPEITISVGVGAASSRETKYAYRWVKENEIPKGFEKDSLKVRNGKYDKLYRIPNQDIGELENTLLKMARKRAKVSGVMALPGCSELFKE